MSETGSSPANSAVSDARLASVLAGAAGDLLLALRESSGLAGRALSDQGDTESNEFLLAKLATLRPNDAVLSEESADSPVRLSADRVWIIDPLDGSREYGLPGRADWAVHVALWQRHRGITAAAVSQPALNATYGTDDPSPNARDSASSPRTEPIILVSDTRPPTYAAAVAAAVHGRLQPMGSAGAKAMAVLRGDADAYLHDGGQWEWDSAAPVGVTLAARLHASRVDGTALTYNREHPYLPDLLICRTALATTLLSAVAVARS